MIYVPIHGSWSLLWFVKIAVNSLSAIISQGILAFAFFVILLTLIVSTLNFMDFVSFNVETQLRKLEEIKRKDSTNSSSKNATCFPQFHPPNINVSL